MYSKFNLIIVFFSIIAFVCQFYCVPIENDQNTIGSVVNNQTSFNKSDCLLPPLDGDGWKACHAYFVKYYYDHATKTCKTFVYGGCGGNANRFSSEQMCLDSCLQ